MLSSIWPPPTTFSNAAVAFVKDSNFAAAQGTTALAMNSFPRAINAAIPFCIWLAQCTANEEMSCASLKDFSNASKVVKISAK